MDRKAPASGIQRLVAVVAGGGGSSSVRARIPISRGVDVQSVQLPLPVDLDLATLSSSDADWLSVRLDSVSIATLLDGVDGVVKLRESGKSEARGKLFFERYASTLYVVSEEQTAVYSWPSDHYYAVAATDTASAAAVFKPKLEFQRITPMDAQATTFTLEYGLNEPVVASVLYELHANSLAELTHVKQSFVLKNSSSLEFPNVRELIIKEEGGAAPVARDSAPSGMATRALARAATMVATPASSVMRSSGGLIREFSLPGKFHITPQGSIRVSGPTIRFATRDNDAHVEYWALPGAGKNPIPQAVIPMKDIPAGAILFNGTAVLKTNGQTLHGGRFAFEQVPAPTDVARPYHVIRFDPLPTVTVTTKKANTEVDSISQTRKIVYVVTAENRTSTALSIHLVVTVDTPGMALTAESPSMQQFPFTPYAGQKVNNHWRVFFFKIPAHSSFTSRYWSNIPF